MKIFYHCYGSAHSSITAANIHLGHLPGHRRATPAELRAQPLFDRARYQDIGTPWFLGTDARGHDVYCIGLHSGRSYLAPALLDFLAALGIDRDELILDDALRHGNWALRVGGLMSRRLGLISLGRPLSAWGIWLKYWRFVDLVDSVQREAARRTGDNPLSLTGARPGPIIG